LAHVAVNDTWFHAQPKSYIGKKSGKRRLAGIGVQCPNDNQNYFRIEGSSYEWNAIYNGQPVDRPNAFRSQLMYDYENFHMAGGTNGAKNVLMGDGRAVPNKIGL
jgi:hypothetical protein